MASNTIRGKVMTQQNNITEDSSRRPASFTVTEAMLQSLRQTKPWVKFLSILGFIGIFFMTVSGIVNIFAFSNIKTETASLPFLLTGALDILMGLFYFFPALFLFRFASSINRLLNGGGPREMEEALSNQRSFWKFMGILTLVFFTIAVIGIVAAIAIPQLARLNS